MTTSEGPRWLADLTVVVENTSQEPIYALRYGVVFTQLGWPRSALESELTFGTYDPDLGSSPICPDTKRPELAPGAQTALRFSPESVARLDHMVAAWKPPQPSPLEFVLEFVQQRKSGFGQPYSDRRTTAERLASGPIVALALSSDGRTLALARMGGDIEVAMSGATPRSIPYGLATPWETLLAFSTNGSEILVCTRTRLTLLDVSTGRILGTTDVDNAYPAAATADLNFVLMARNRSTHNWLVGMLGVIVTLSPYGGILGSRDKGEAIVIDRRSGRREKLLAGSTVLGLCPSEDGKIVAVLTESDGEIRVVERETRRVLRTLKKVQTVEIALSPKGDLLAFFEEHKTVRVVSTVTGIEVGRLDPKRRVEALRFAPDGAALAASGLDGVVVWSIPSGRILLESCGSYARSAHGMAFSADGRTFAVTAGENAKVFTLPDLP
jgi:WD40 repeat protein